MKKLILLSTLTVAALLSFSACTQAVKIKYIKTPCPKLELINHDITMPPPVKLEIIKWKQ